MASPTEVPPDWGNWFWRAQARQPKGEAVIQWHGKFLLPGVVEDTGRVVTGYKMCASENTGSGWVATPQGKYMETETLDRHYGAGEGPETDQRHKGWYPLRKAIKSITRDTLV